MEKKWKISDTDNIEEYAFNNSLEDFHRKGLGGLVRENIQNSLDARLDAEKPIKVIIQTGEMESDNIPAINEIKERINCLSGCNSYTREIIEHMKESIKKESCKYMSFEDENTKGLTKLNWENYAYVKGVHLEDDNQEFENSRGGSHGIGKIASNAASDINTMYFSNCDEHGEKLIGGTIQLIEHIFETKKYRATGYYTDQKEDETGKVVREPFKYEAYNYNEIFEKKSRGLKIIIPMIKEAYCEDQEIINEVYKNFFIAVLCNKLIVEVNGYVINQDDVLEKIEKEKEFTNDVLTNRYIQTYIDKNPLSIQVRGVGQEVYEFLLYYQYNEEIEKGRVAIVRSIGIKIEDMGIESYKRTRYNAVLIPKTNKEDAFLKSLENQSHTELTVDMIRDKKKKKEAKKFINLLKQEIVKIIKLSLEEENAENEIMDTSELIFTQENSFRNKIKENISTVSITPSGKTEKIVVVKQDINKKISKNIKKDRTEKEKAKSIKRKPSKDFDREVYKYDLRASRVKRIILEEKEQIRLDLNDNYGFENQKECNIFLEAIDGQGKQSMEEMNLENYYKHIIDKSTNSTVQIKNNKVIGVKIMKGIVNLEMELYSNVNKTLKFTYVVEV